MAKRILQSGRASQTKSLTMKIPVALYEEIQAFREQLKNSEYDLIFSASDICVEALENALKIARKEFAVIEGNSPEKTTTPEGNSGQVNRNISNSLSKGDFREIQEDV